jgi:hypothetical protein
LVLRRSSTNLQLEITLPSPNLSPNLENASTKTIGGPTHLLSTSFCLWKYIPAFYPRLEPSSHRTPYSTALDFPEFRKTFGKDVSSVGMGMRALMNLRTKKQLLCGRHYDETMLCMTSALAP